MAEITLNKLNLKALGAVSKTEKNDVVEKAVAQDVAEVNKEILPTEKSKVQENSSPALGVNKKEKVEVVNEAPVSTKISFNDIQKESTKKSEKQNASDKIKSDKQDKIDKALQEATTVKQEKGADIHFNNYESGFHKQRGYVVKKLQNFKYAPKTRLGLIFGLVGITTLVLGVLMIVLPEKHSFSIYKASILEIYYGETPSSIQNNYGTSETPDSIPSPEITTPLNESDEDTTDSSSSEEESNQEASEIEEAPITKVREQKERLRQHLIDKYSN